MRNVDGKGLLAATERAEVGHIPVDADQPQQALDKAGRLAQRHAEQDLHREASLDDSVAVAGLSPTLAGRRSLPDDIWIEPDCQRATALESLLILGPVQGLVAGCARSAHALQLSSRIHEMNSSQICATEPVSTPSST